MKRLTTLLLSAGLILAASTEAMSIDFKAKGEWLVGFTAGDGALVKRVKDKKTGWQKHAQKNNDIFGANQRVRFQLDAVASENLSGTLFFEINSRWGVAAEGGALGADGKTVAVKNAYIDWAVPDADLKFRMGLQTIWLPNAAGGTAIMKADSAAVASSWQINENAGVGFTWFRPANDNFQGWEKGGKGTGAYGANYLDNLDLFLLTVPLTFDGVEVTPWAMYGMIGKNALDGYHAVDSNNVYHRHPNPVDAKGWTGTSGGLDQTLTGRFAGFNATAIGPTSKAYGSLFFAGLPVKLTLWDPLNVEFDFNYGYAEPMGNFYATVRNNNADVRRGSSKRQGWLAKLLVEYKLDWGVPGIFGWYASGDDGSIKNGSERMPSVSPAGCFTTFMGDMEYWDWAPDGLMADKQLSYAGTWGIGLQLRDMSFVENLKHTFRVAYWGGTNSPSMVKFMAHPDSWNAGTLYDGPYLTTNDGILEFNLVNSWQIYENFEANLELGYLVNFIDKDTWKRSWMNGESFQKQDAWKAQLIFAYRF
ncbi:MAG: outer membrane homotrimeric porin [Desulfovibrio sp.]|nr:outer membrane homotrimeric porin [Desulfovibrio sp.]